MKVPAGEKSKSTKACSSENWILESGSDSEYLLRVVVVVVVVVGGGELGGGWDDQMWARSGSPPSRPNSSSSMKSSLDWKARDKRK